MSRGEPFLCKRIWNLDRLQVLEIAQPNLLLATFEVNFLMCKKYCLTSTLRSCIKGRWEKYNCFLKNLIMNFKLWVAVLNTSPRDLCTIILAMAMITEQLCLFWLIKHETWEYSTDFMVFFISYLNYQNLIVYHNSVGDFKLYDIKVNMNLLK